MINQLPNTVADDISRCIILFFFFQVRRNSSSASTDSGRGADCSTTVSHITSNTSMRRDRLVAASHFGSQRSLWCELPEVCTSYIAIFCLKSITGYPYC